MKDIRTLCQQCINDYRNAGYRVYLSKKPKEPCDKCGQMGYICEVKRGGGRGSYRQNRGLLR